MLCWDVASESIVLGGRRRLSFFDLPRKPHAKIPGKTNTKENQRVMARRRPKKASSASEYDPAGVAQTQEAQGHTNPRALQTLPSAVSTQRLARSQSKICELIDHAHHHVELTMRLCVDTDAGAEGGWPTMIDGNRTRVETDGKLSIARKVLRVFLRKKQNVVRLVDFSRKPHDDARYNRLQKGYTALKQHVTDTDASRKQLEDALATFRTRALAMESALPPEARQSHVMMTSLHACFAQSADLVDKTIKILAEDVAEQTQTKLNQLATFKVTLEHRDRIKLDFDVAKHQLQQFQKLSLKQRSAIPGAYDLELAQRKHEYNELRRRVAALTVATEHVFQFYSHLDQCIVDPEMSLTHRQLTRFFEKHARVFEKNVK